MYKAGTPITVICRLSDVISQIWPRSKTWCIGTPLCICTNEVGLLAGSAPPQQRDQGLIGNYHQHVSINPNLQYLAERLNLKQMVPVAVDRAVSDIITPVVERSVTIACMTTQELILKVREGG